MVLSTLAILQALEHLPLARRLAEFDIAVGHLAVVALELAQTGDALGLDVLDEGLAGLELGCRGGGRGSGGSALQGAGLLEVCLHLLEVRATVRAAAQRLRERLAGNVLPALAQGTDTLQTEAE